MNLDLGKLETLAEDADLSRCTGKYSAVYEELDKAWEVLADLLLVKKATQKTVVKLLQEAGMKELKLHNFNGWWSRSATKVKREQYIKALTEKEARKKPLIETCNVGK